MSKAVISSRSHTVLVVVAHTDDETLGLGGVIARHVLSGDSVFAISMTDGVGARGQDRDVEIKARALAAQRAASILGFTWLEAGSFPDNALDTVALLSIAQAIEKAKAEVKPTLIYTHSAADLNIDHRIVAQATLTAFRPQPGETWEEIRSFEVPSATDFSHKSIARPFHPNLYIDITATWQKKLAALKEYSAEMRAAPHSRSLEGIETLARYRGNQAGLAMAEAFETLRKIER
jgi:LmbE family N-acetylglucosaminyl deacetylase